MRKNSATAVLGLTVLVVLAVVVLTWRPWAAGANARITASGLVPVLTLLLGQLGSWTISSGSAEQALAVRKAELEHEAQESKAAAERADEAAKRERTEAESREQQQQLVALMSATTSLGPAIFAAIEGTSKEALPSKAFSQTKVALLTAMPVLELDETLANTAFELIYQMDDVLLAADDGEAVDQASRSLLGHLTSFERDLSRSQLLRRDRH